MTEKEMKEYENRQASLETVCRRHNSTMVVKKHAIPYASLHKKTYFNALEKILISPRILKQEELPKKGQVPQTSDLAVAAFDQVIK